MAILFLIKKINRKEFLQTICRRLLQILVNTYHSLQTFFKKKVSRTNRINNYFNLKTLSIILKWEGSNCFHLLYHDRFG